MEPLVWAYAFGKPKGQIELDYNLEKLWDTEFDQLETLVKRVSC